MKKTLDVNTPIFLRGSAEFSQHRDACVHMSEEHMIRVRRLVEALSTRGLLERKAVATQRSFQLPIWKNPPQEHRQWQCHLSVFCRADLSWEQKKSWHMEVGFHFPAARRLDADCWVLPVETRLLYSVPSPFF